jgi:hypothetical protein
LTRKPTSAISRGRRVVAGGRGELAATGQVLAPAGEQLVNLGGGRRVAQLRLGAAARPVELLQMPDIVAGRRVYGGPDSCASVLTDRGQSGDRSLGRNEDGVGTGAAP